MKTQNSPKRFFVTLDRQVLIACPECNFSKFISVTQFRQHKHLMKIKCLCGHSFRVHIEYRRYCRKKTKFEGLCDLNSTFTDSWKVAIVDISLGGACLELSGENTIKVGDQGTLRFVLDDQKKTSLVKPVIIKSVSNDRIGCQFAENKDFEKELGFYLLR